MSRRKKFRYRGFRCHHKERKSKSFGLLEIKVNGVHFTELGKDKQGSYLPYCDYNVHPGIVDAGRSEICEMRGCRHYKKLYIN